jgi:hypothetical protein
VEIQEMLEIHRSKNIWLFEIPRQEAKIGPVFPTWTGHIELDPSIVFCPICYAFHHAGSPASRVVKNFSWDTPAIA